MKEVTIAVGNEDQVRAAFQGVDIVFVSLFLYCARLAPVSSHSAYPSVCSKSQSTTDFWAHFGQRT